MSLAGVVMVVVSPTTIGARGVVQVLVHPFGQGQMSRTLHHDEVTVEALLQDVAGPGNVRLEGDDDDGLPTVLGSQPAQLPSLTLGGRRIWSEALHRDARR